MQVSIGYTGKRSFKLLKKKNDKNGGFLILVAITDECVFILINLYNPNTEKEQVSTQEKMNLMLQTTDDLENKIIIIGGDFNLFLDSVLEGEGGSLVLKKYSVSKLIEFKEIYNLCDIWRIRNANEKRFTFRQKHRAQVFYKEDQVILLFQMSCRNQLKIQKFYLCYLLITLQFSFLQLVPNLHLREILPSS